MKNRSRHSTVYFLLVALFSIGGPALGENPQTPEQVLRILVKANADLDMETFSKYMAHDSDAIGYTIGGRKYVGWNAVAEEMQAEFDRVERLEIPIKDLQVWEHGDVAWFNMELDYIRYVSKEPTAPPHLLELRESGVLERRNGKWLLVSWHESSRTSTLSAAISSHTHSSREPSIAVNNPVPQSIDLRGTWYIEEEDTTYYATLDEDGNGPYTRKNGKFAALEFKDRKLLGTWEQTENDREGGFEVLFTEDGNEARGIWWYTRVGTQGNIPPREHGGTYYWKRESAQ